MKLGVVGDILEIAADQRVVAAALVPEFQEMVREVTAEEAGDAADENLHGCAPAIFWRGRAPAMLARCAWMRSAARTAPPARRQASVMRALSRAKLSTARRRLAAARIL